MMFTIDDIKCCAATHTGRVRTDNEDRYICRTVIDDHHVLLAAIDGCGGMAGGSRAASIAEDVTVSFLIRVRESYNHILCDAMTYANNYIYEERMGPGRYSNMGCVMSGVLVDTRTLQAEVVHLGDTRVYRIDADGMTQLTVDHSPVGEMVRGGILNEFQARMHPMKHMVSRVMGHGPLHGFDGNYFDTRQLQLEGGTTLLVCSDGLTDMLSSREIHDIINGGTFYGAADRLVDAANRAGGKDNVTAVLLQVPQAAGPLIDQPDGATSDRDRRTEPDKADGFDPAEKNIFKKILKMFKGRT